MNQSTNSMEDKLKARLHEYETPPPPGAGGVILDRINGGSGSSTWGITLALLLGVLLIGGGFYMTTTDSRDEDTHATANSAEEERAISQTNMEQASPISQKTTEVNTAVATSTRSNSGRRVDNADDAIEQKTIESQATIDETHAKSAVKAVVSASSIEEQLPDARTSVIPTIASSQQQTSAITEMDQEVTEGSAGPIHKDEQIQKVGLLEMGQMDYKSINLLGLPLVSDELTVVPYTPAVVVRPDEQKQYHFYGDLGIFFLYNHLQPNKNDGLLMENFETSGSFSLDRLSYYAEMGVKRDLSKKVTLRAAAVTNFFAQKYSFNIREEASSSVQASVTDSNLLTPVFDRQIVRMDHFLISAGARVSADLKVFNNDFNRLMLGLGYHHILNPEHTFEYKGEVQKIEYPHQLTASFGFRKVVWQSEGGELSLLPVLRYGLVHKASQSSALTIKPFSVGLTVGYGLK